MPDTKILSQRSKVEVGNLHPGDLSRRGTGRTTEDWEGFEVGRRNVDDR